jgi:hypothetical protein
MSGVAERDFSNFELGDNVYALAGGLIPEVADRLNFELGDQPNPDRMYELVGVLGPNKVLGLNKEVEAIDLETAGDLLERSGVQKPLNRSLWTPNLEFGDLGSGPAFTVVTGAIANWQDRTAQLVAEAVREGTIGPDVRVVTGNRVMGKVKSEATNPNVVDFHNKKNRFPTDTEYATRFVLPVLDEAGAQATLTSYDTDTGDEIADNFARNIKPIEGDEPGYEKLFEPGVPVVFARVANAGVQLAVQFRQAIRVSVGPQFDSESDPDVFILTDSFPIARTEEQKADSVNYQNPYTGLRQAVLTGKVLLEAAAG